MESGPGLHFSATDDEAMDELLKHTLMHADMKKAEEKSSSISGSHLSPAEAMDELLEHTLLHAEMKDTEGKRLSSNSEGPGPEMKQLMLELNLKEKSAGFPTCAAFVAASSAWPQGHFSGGQKQADMPDKRIKNIQVLGVAEKGVATAGKEGTSDKEVADGTADDKDASNTDKGVDMGLAAHKEVAAHKGHKEVTADKGITADKEADKGSVVDGLSDGQVAGQALKMDAHMINAKQRIIDDKQNQNRETFNECRNKGIAGELKARKTWKETSKVKAGRGQ